MKLALGLFLLFSAGYPLPASRQWAHAFDYPLIGMAFYWIFLAASEDALKPKGEPKP